MQQNYREFVIEVFEAGDKLWHARIWRSDEQSISIEGHSFPHIEVGFAWQSVEAAVADAKTWIDRQG